MSDSTWEEKATDILIRAAGSDRDLRDILSEQPGNAYSCGYTTGRRIGMETACERINFALGKILGGQPR